MSNRKTYKIDTSVLDNHADFEFSIMTSSDLEESLQVLRDGFYPRELIIRVLNLTENAVAVTEMEKLLRKTFEDGLSVIAREKSSGRIVSVSFCKLQIKPEPGSPGSFDEVAATFTSPEAKDLMDFMIKVDKKVDMFAKYSTDTLVELTFLGTLQDYCNRHLAKDVCRVCIQIASQTPAAAINILCTSPWSERISKGLGFELLYEANYAEFTTPGGVKYTDIVGEDETFTLRAYPLSK